MANSTQNSQNRGVWRTQDGARPGQTEWINEDSTATDPSSSDSRNPFSAHNSPQTNNTFSFLFQNLSLIDDVRWRWVYPPHQYASACCLFMVIVPREIGHINSLLLAERSARDSSSKKRLQRFLYFHSMPASGQQFKKYAVSKPLL